MSTRSFFAIAAIGLVLFSPFVAAQADNGPAGIPVRIWAVGQGGDTQQNDGYSYWVSSTYINPNDSSFVGTYTVPGTVYYVYATPEYSTITSELRLTGTFLPSLPTDPNPSTTGYAVDGSSTDSSFATLNANLGIVRMMPGVTYTINTIADNVTGAVNVQAPPGYRVNLNGQIRNGCPLDGQIVVRIVPVGDEIPGTAGFASKIAALKVDWKVALGSLRNGDSAGYLELADSGVASNLAYLFTPAALSYEQTSNEVYVYRVGNVIRQIFANQVAMDIVTLTNSSYEIRCYEPAQGQYFPNSGGFTFSGMPFVSYRVEPGTPEAGYTSDPTVVVLKITKETRNIADLNATSVPITRREVMTLQRSGTWPSFRWARSEWTLDGQPSLTRTVVQSSGPASSRVESVSVGAPQGANAVSLTRTYDATSAYGELLKTEVVGTGTGLTTAFQYNTDINQPGSFGSLNAVSLPGGGWARFDYYDSSVLDGYAGGKIKYQFRPFGSSPASASAASVASGEVTYFEYGADPFKFLTRPTLTETYINGLKTARSTTSYLDMNESAAGGHIVRAIRNDYTSSSTYLQTVTQFYSEDASMAFARGKNLSVQRPDGTKTVTVYETGNWDGTSFSPIYGAGPSSRISVIDGNASTGTYCTDGKWYNANGYEPIYLVDSRSTKSVVIRDERALVVRTESYAWANSNWQLLSWTNYAYNLAGLLVSQTSSDGTTATSSYDGLLKISETDATGVTTQYTYDAAGRVSTRTVVATAPLAALTTHYRYDAMNNVLETAVGWGQTEQLVTTATYDDAGRPMSLKKPGLGAMTYRYDPSNRSTFIVRADGGAVVEITAIDGRPLSKTGTGTIAQYFTYGVDPVTGNMWQAMNSGTATSPRWSRTYKDWAGRTAAEVKPTTGSTASTFDGNYASSTVFVKQTTYDDVAGHTSTGHPITVTETGKAPARFVYDGLGRISRSGLDVDANGTLDLAANDRITEQDQYFELQNGDWWSHEESRAYTTAGNGSPTITNVKRTRMTGFASGVIAETQTTDVDQNVTIAVTKVSPKDATVTMTKTVSGVTNPEIVTQVAGLTVSSTSTAGLTTTFMYDTLRRMVGVTDARGNTTTTAYISGSTLARTVTDATNAIVATNTYDALGRKVSVADAADHHTYSSYTLRGGAYRTWGDAAIPVQYDYDPVYGEKTAMSTFRGGTGWDQSDWPGTGANTAGTTGTADKTTWAYDPASGSLSSKSDPLGRAVTYTYNARGQLASRSWARGVTTTYNYDPATTEQLGILYSDSTPALHYTYNRLGQTARIDDVTGSRYPVYTMGGTQSAEQLDANFYGSRVLTYKLDTTAGHVLNRVLGYTFASGSTTEQNLTYDFDPASGRVSDVGTASTFTGAAHTFNYGYLPNSNLISGLTVDTGHPFSVTRTYETQRDVLTAIDTKWSTTSRTRFDYMTNSLRQRVSRTQSGDAFNDFGPASSVFTSFAYDAKGELTSGYEYLGSTVDSTKKLYDRQHEYAYDNIGNRQWSNRTGNSGTRDNYTTNELNQYLARENNTVTVSGTSDGNSRVGIVGQTTAAARQGLYWSQTFTPAYGSGPWSGAITVYSGKSGAGPGGTDLVRQDVRLAQGAAPQQSFTYDNDGNLLTDGVWSYTWDAENRLVSMTTTSAAVAGGYPNRILQFRYDYLGRRVQKLVYDGATNQLIIGRRFAYTGWSLIAEYTDTGAVSIGSIVRSYTWGLDIARTFADAGGVGALLEITDHASKKTFLPTYDGNGNVTAVLNADTGAAAAVYEYSPYGETLRSDANDLIAATQPFRFSTKYCDSDSGLYDYGRRYYSTSTGRFLGRDPLSEKGGVNLYGLCFNDSVNKWDVLGLSGMGAVVGGNFDIGVGPMGGAGAQGSAGFGGFTGNGGSLAPNYGVFATGGVFAYNQAGTIVSLPANGQTPWALCGALGISGGIFWTNANNADQLRGPFSQYNFYFPVLTVNIAVDGSGTIYVAATMGPSLGYGYSQYASNTAAATVKSLDGNQPNAAPTAAKALGNSGQGSAGPRITTGLGSANVNGAMWAGFYGINFQNFPSSQASTPPTSTLQTTGPMITLDPFIVEASRKTDSDKSKKNPSGNGQSGKSSDSKDDGNQDDDDDGWGSSGSVSINPIDLELIADYNSSNAQ